MVDLVDQQPALRRLQQIHGHDATTHRPRRRQRQVRDLRGERTGQWLAAARGVGDPVGRAAIDGVDHLVAGYQRADVPAGLVHVLLDVEDGVDVAAQGGFVFENGLSRVPVVDAGQQPPPRAEERLEHHRVAHLLDGFQRRLRREGDHDTWDRHTRLLQGGAGEHFVAAGSHRVVGTDRRHPQAVQPAGEVVGPRVAQAADEHGVIANCELRIADCEFLRAAQFEGHLPGVNALVVHPPLSQGRKDHLLLNPHPRTQHTNFHFPISFLISNF